MERKTMLGAALALALTVGACGGQPGVEGEDGEVGDVAAEVDQRAQEALTEVSDEPGPGAEPPYATSAPTPASAVPNPPDQKTVVGNLQAVGNSGVEGGVTLAEVPGGTQVTASVTRAPATGAYRVALARGICTAPGGDVAALGGLRVGAGGVGTVTDTIPLPAATVMNGQHVLVVRVEGAASSVPPVACAPIPVNR